MRAISVVKQRRKAANHSASVIGEQKAMGGKKLVRNLLRK